MIGESDYPMISSWWEKRGHGVLPYGMLPATGVLVEAQGVGICAAWMYMDTTIPLAFLAWFTTNPSVAASNTLRIAVEALIDFMEKEAANQGRKFMVSSVPRGSGLHKTLNRLGWGNSAGGEHVHVFKQCPS